MLNLANDPSGVSSCYNYGDSYLLLDNSIRLRTTFASADTFTEGVSMVRTDGRE